MVVSAVQKPTEKHSTSEVSNSLSHHTSHGGVSTSSDDHVIFDNNAQLGTTQGFQLEEQNHATASNWLDGTASFAIGDTGNMRPKSKFFQSDSTLSDASELHNRNNSSTNFGVPFQKYQNSMSIVFDDGYSSKKDLGSCVFGQQV